MGTSYSHRSGCIGYLVRQDDALMWLLNVERAIFCDHRDNTGVALCKRAILLSMMNGKESDIYFSMIDERERLCYSRIKNRLNISKATWCNKETRNVAMPVNGY